MMLVRGGLTLARSFIIIIFLIYIKDLFICLFNINFNDKIICKKKLSDKMNNNISYNS